MFSRSNFPGLVCLALGLVGLACAAFGCCSTADDCTAPADEVRTVVKMTNTEQQAVSASVAVIDELGRKLKSFESLTDSLTLELSRQADAHAADLANVSQRITQSEFELSQAVDRVSDLERYVADTKPHLPKVATAEPIDKPVHLVEPVAHVSKDLETISYDEAAALADTTGQPFFAIVQSEDCLPCKQMSRETLEPMARAGELAGLIVATIEPNEFTRAMNIRCTPALVGFRKRNGEWTRYTLQGRQSIDRVREFVALLKKP